MGDQAASDTWVTDRLDLSLWPVCGTAHLDFSTKDPLAIAEDTGEWEALTLQRILQLGRMSFRSLICQQQGAMQPVSHLGVVQVMDNVPSWKGGRWFYY